VLSRWTNYILSIGSEVIVWCVLSCGNLIEFKRMCDSRMHQACHRIGNVCAWRGNDPPRELLSESNTGWQGATLEWLVDCPSQREPGIESSICGRESTERYTQEPVVLFKNFDPKLFLSKRNARTKIKTEGKAIQWQAQFVIHPMGGHQTMTLLPMLHCACKQEPSTVSS